MYDFWHTSPNFFLIRLGMLMMIMAGTYAWCRWGAGQWGFSPLIQLGKTSLLVYWVHIEFVYGRFTILPSRGVGIGVATEGLIVICVSMLLLSLGRTGLDGKGAELWKWAEGQRGRVSRERAGRPTYTKTNTRSPTLSQKTRQGWGTHFFLMCGSRLRRALWRGRR